MADHSADVEDRWDWELTLPELGEKPGENAVLIAESQKNYTESIDNFVVVDDETEEIAGYTRFGAWYAQMTTNGRTGRDEYREWDAAFAAFCLSYGGMNEEDALWDISAKKWMENLWDEGKLQKLDYIPLPGDIVFVEDDQARIVAAVVTAVNEDSIRVLQGDYLRYGDIFGIEELEYALDDFNIQGYLSVDEHPEPEEETAEDELNELETEEIEETAEPGLLDTLLGALFGEPEQTEDELTEDETEETLDETEEMETALPETQGSGLTFEQQLSQKEEQQEKLESGLTFEGGARDLSIQQELASIATGDGSSTLQREWEDSLPILTGEWNTDVAAVALSQVGYREEYVIDAESGAPQRFSRYGIWYEASIDGTSHAGYEAWDAAFAAFCLAQGGVSRTDVPYALSAEEWIPALMENHPELLRESFSVDLSALNGEPILLGDELLDDGFGVTPGMGMPAEGYLPRPGDLVFLWLEDMPAERSPYTVGVITAVDESGVTIVRGEVKDDYATTTVVRGSGALAGDGAMVESERIAFESDSIVFYLALPEQEPVKSELDTTEDEEETEPSEEDEPAPDYSEIDSIVGAERPNDDIYTDGVGGFAAAYTVDPSDLDPYGIMTMALTDGIELTEEGKNYITAIKMKWHDPSECADLPAGAKTPWHDMPTDGTTIPANAHLRFDVDYTRIDPAELKANEYRIYMHPGNALHNLMASGDIIIGGEARGAIHASSDAVVLEFDKSWVDKLVTRNETVGEQDKQFILGEFYYQGELDLSSIGEGGGLNLNLGGVSLNIPTDDDAISRYADVEVEKEGGSELVQDASGNWFIEYTLTVTAGSYGSPQVWVRDTMANTAFIDKANCYVGVSSTASAAQTAGSAADGPVEQVLAGTAAATGTVNLDADGRMIWTLGDMGANEKRTLTYRVAVKNNYVGVPHSNDPLSNRADLFSKTHPHGSDITNFVPEVKADLQKVAGAPRYNKMDGLYYVDYTVRVTADSNNSYPMTNVKIRDDLSRQENNGYRSAISYLEDSIRLFKDSGRTQEITDLAQYHTGSRSGYVGDANPYMAADGNAFELYIGDLNPGESRWITYTMTIDLAQAQTMSNGVTGIYNRAQVYADDSKNGPQLNAYNTNTELSNYTWERKMGGAQIRSNVLQEVGGEVYDATVSTPAGSKLPTISNPGNHTVGAGAYRYTVIVNEAGEWDVTSSNWNDALGSQFLEYDGYVRVDVYNSVNGSGGEDAVRERLESQTPKRTIWVKVDGQQSFGFNASQIGLEGLADGSLNTDAYVLTYYARVPASASSFGQVVVGNSFGISGTVGNGSGGFVLAGISTNVNVTVVEQGVGKPNKSAWYFDRDDDAFAAHGLNHGAQYWVIEIDGSKVNANSIFEESANLDGRRALLRKDESHVGFFTANLGEDVNGVPRKFTEVYENLDAFMADVDAGLIEEVPKEVYNITWTNDGRQFDEGMTADGKPIGYSSDFSIRFNQTYAFNAGEKLYWVVRSEPKVLPGDGLITSYTNKINYSYNGKWQPDHPQDIMKIEGPHGSLDKGNDGVFRVSNNGTTFEWLNEQGQYVAYDGTAPNAVLQTRKLCVDENFARITTGNSTYTYEDGEYILWNLTINRTGMMAGGEYTIEDILPDGVELAYVRPSYINFNQVNSTRFPGENWTGANNQPENILARKNDEWVAEGWTEHRTQSSLKGSNTNMSWNRMGIYYYTDGNRIRIDTGEVYGNSTNGSDRVEFQVVCRVTDPNIYFEDTDFTNTAELYSDTGLVEADSNTVTLRTPGLNKSLLADLTSSGGMNVLSEAVLPYTLTINDGATDMNPDGDTIPVPLVDRSSANMSINMDTLRIYADLTPAQEAVVKGNKFNPDGSAASEAGLDANLYYSGKPGQGNVGGGSIRIEVDKVRDEAGNLNGETNVKFYNLPDGRRLTIWYKVSIAIKDGGSITNDAYWEGYEQPEGGETSVDNMRYEAGASAGVAGRGGLSITKHDGMDTEVLLEGAKFTLYRAKYETHGSNMLFDTSGNPCTHKEHLGYPAVYDAHDTEVAVERDENGHLVRWYDRSTGAWVSFVADDLDKFHHRFVLDSNGGLQLDLDDKLAEKTTDENGLITYGQGDDEDRIHYNKVYAVVETEAPEGYDIDTTPHFFVIPQSDDKIASATEFGDYFYHSDWPEEVHVCSRYNEDGLPTYYLDAYDYRGSAQVTKTFGGLDPTYTPGTYRFGIWSASDVTTDAYGPVAVHGSAMLSTASVTYHASDFGWYDASSVIFRQDAEGNWEKRVVVGGKESWIAASAAETEGVRYGILPGREKVATFENLSFDQPYYIFELSDSGEPMLDYETATVNGMKYTAVYSRKGAEVGEENRVVPGKTPMGDAFIPMVTASNNMYSAQVTKNFANVGGELLEEGIEGEYTFVIRKVDFDDDLNPVPGRVLDTQTIVWAASDVEPEKTAVFKGLEPGEIYVISEIQPADGKIIEDGTAGEIYGRTFIVRYEDKNELGPGMVWITDLDPDMSTTTVTNQTPVTLPHTGSIGTHLFTMGGLSLMALALLLYACSRKRKREGGTD